MAFYFSKPFDSVCHNLHAMLRAYSCEESAIRLIRSSLSNRFERVESNGFFWIATCGLSQGRLLVREFCTRHSFLLCRKYQFFSLKYQLKRTLFWRYVCEDISVLPFLTPLFVDSRTILSLCHGAIISFTNAARRDGANILWLLDFDWLLKSYDCLIFTFHWFISAG